MGKPRSHFLPVLGIVLGSALLRVVLAVRTPLMEAEAYYWTWSRSLDWGYRDHPPAVAVLIRATTSVFGDSALGIRTGPILLSVLGSLIFYRFCRRISAPRVAVVSLGVLSFAPFWLPFGVVALPDAPLLFFWTASLCFFLDACTRDRAVLWVLAGMATGLAILSKYNGFQLPLVFFAFLLATAKGRGLLRTKGPWITIGVAGLLAAPNLLWNLEHGGETVARPFHNGLEFGAGLRHLGLFAVLPFGLLTPLLAIAWVRHWVAHVRRGRLLRDETFLFLSCACWLPLAVFGALSAVTMIHGHWVASAFVAAVPLLTENLFVRDPVGPSPRFLRVGMWLGGAVMALVPILALALPFLAPKRPQSALDRLLVRADVALEGHDLLRQRLEHELLVAWAEPGGQDMFFATRSFHLAGMIEWLTAGRIAVVPLRDDSVGQYRFWDDPSQLAGRDALFFTKTRRISTRGSIKSLFERVKRLESVEVVEEDGVTVRYFVWRCRGYSGRRW